MNLTIVVKNKIKCIFITLLARSAHKHEKKEKLLQQPASWLVSAFISLTLKFYVTIFTIMQEKCQEQNVDLYMTFVDLTKAFDIVSRAGLLENYGKFWLSCQIHSNGVAVP